MVDAIANQPSVRLLFVDESERQWSEADLHIVVSDAFDADDFVGER